jgi:hypothetical protein
MRYLNDIYVPIFGTPHATIYIRTNSFFVDLGNTGRCKYKIRKWYNTINIILDNLSTLYKWTYVLYTPWTSG